ncbi:unnamed protein product [Moneuplotes crassus]|uniref:Methyltransferase type 11 domain-containing protein n=1 Tax=Euplotes crassus TaxID=5936 RepID=A0AAD2D1D1_EUPCR|nr:unnamed protein product [Moneuplotes crassus]
MEERGWMKGGGLEVDHERMAFLRQKFNDWAYGYEDTVEKVSIQSSFNLYSAARAHKASKILEVGAGCGLAARIFISYLMKKHCSFFVSDISEKMNEIFVQRFLETDTASDPEVKLVTLEESDVIDVDQEINNVEDNFLKRIFSCRANNECLPFSDNSFDLYIACLSLMIVPNYKNQLTEAYRVVEEGGAAAFSVWGREENCTMLTFVCEVFKEAGIEYTSGSTLTFKLSDKGFLIKDIKEVGFKEVKGFYTMTNPCFPTVNEAYDYSVSSANAQLSLKNCTSEEREHLKLTFYQMYEERYGNDTSELMSWETLVIIATK